MKSIPNQSDFLNKDQNSLLPNTIHSTEIRDNGKKVDIYLLSTGTRAGDSIGIFYFEDDTEKQFEDGYYFTDLFVMHFKSELDAELEYVITSQRNDNSCVKSIPPNISVSFTLDGDCSAGAVITKQTENGWAAYVKFFVDFEKPTYDSPYYIQWAYVDAKGVDDDGWDISSISYWPNNWFFYGTAYPVQEENVLVNVNFGRIEINDFLHMPNEILTENLSQNKIDCADNTIDVVTDSNEEGYTKNDVARITAKINSIEKNIKVYLTIYDQQDNRVLKKSTTFTDSDPIFLVDLGSFERGVYKAAVEFGINGPKDQVLFKVDIIEILKQKEPNQCNLYLLYDENKSSLIIFGQVYDPSGSSIDGIDIFVDRKGDGFTELTEDDIRLYISKNNFGGEKISASQGWSNDDKYREKGNARINKLGDGYEIYAEVPVVTKNFKIAIEQSDNTFYEFKKSRFPPNSFSTAPQTWATVNFVDKTPIKYAASNWSPDEVVVTQSIDLNLILVGDQWTENQKKEIQSKLSKSIIPITNSELHLTGAKYLYQYDFVSASDDFSNGLFNLMKKESERINPFYGENEYNNPWGLASWVKTNHTEWTSPSQQRFEIDYNLVDANKVEEYIFNELISKNPSFHLPHSVNLVFIADDMDKIDFLHNYKLQSIDASTKQYHKAVGLMGYGGNYNTYFFDLYAAPWDDFQGLPGHYDQNLINEYTNFHDFTDEKDRNQLFVNYINNATALLVTPSYVYPPVYKTNYLIDLVIVTEPSSTANNVLIDHFIDKEKIISELEQLIPHSSWELNFSLERLNSRDLATDVKDLLNSANKVPAFSEDFGPIVSILNEENVSRELISWASTRESSNFKDFKNVANSQWTIPVLVVIGEGDNQWYIGNYGTVGLAAAHPDDANQPCCAIAISNDKTVWEEGYGLSDLVIHEVGHVVGLMHPFMGYSSNYEFFINNYFNWIASPMAYSSPLHGCAYWYSLHDEGPCGMVDTNFTYFDKETISRGIATYLVKSAENNVYRTLLELEKSGTSPYNLPSDVKSQVDNIESEIKKAKDAFRTNKLDGMDGAIELGIEAARDSQILASDYTVEYKQTVTDDVKITIPAWIKDQADWWVAGSINDNEFVNSIQYLIKEKIIVIPPTDAEAQDGSKDIPDWVKNNVRWWSTGTISDKELVSALQHLIKQGIIKVGN
ncbi:hypothetical protein [Nitrosopumilus ureiphilus]|uniref:Uncharacterized protein n=1 Tax=Nitrosopumilus ureiphilus TaxID=1470067 RepID=A0A7D5M822_9ARCH|nr:hypothetical protein [Nitrosopumilus ureiphilus]QLH07207.1 hypothetical protein C5F50_09050 [Nitrosopumilus ureiphilus]